MRAIKADTSALIEAINSKINTMKADFTSYYDRAPRDAGFPYGVIGGFTASPLSAGDLSMFDADIWTDDKLPSATEELESLCDELRNFLHNRTIFQNGVAAHIAYEKRGDPDDRERDLSHRSLTFAARVFYYE